jgi:hypothetical protein
VEILEDKKQIMTTEEIYTKILPNFNYTLIGSRAIKKYINNFRSPSDIDILVPDLAFLISYFDGHKEIKEIKTYGEYEVEMVSIFDAHGGKIDAIQGHQESEIIDNERVATLKSILDSKKAIFESEIKRPAENVSIEKIQKHYYDILEIKEFLKNKP